MENPQKEGLAKLITVQVGMYPLNSVSWKHSQQSTEDGTSGVCGPLVAPPVDWATKLGSEPASLPRLGATHARGILTWTSMREQVAKLVHVKVTF